jgi:hypothetical protein
MGNIVCLAKIGQNWASQCSRTGDVRLQVRTCCEGRTKLNRDRVGHTVLYITSLWKLWKGKEIKTKEEEIK